jgi:hypothetical protein
VCGYQGRIAAIHRLCHLLYPRQNIVRRTGGAAVASPFTHRVAIALQLAGQERFVRSLASARCRHRAHPGLFCDRQTACPPEPFGPRRSLQAQAFSFLLEPSLAPRLHAAMNRVMPRTAAARADQARAPQPPEARRQQAAATAAAADTDSPRDVLSALPLPRHPRAKTSAKQPQAPEQSLAALEGHAVDVLQLLNSAWCDLPALFAGTHRRMLALPSSNPRLPALPRVFQTM